MVWPRPMPMQGWMKYFKIVKYRFARLYGRLDYLFLYWVLTNQKATRNYPKCISLAFTSYWQGRTRKKPFGLLFSSQVLCIGKYFLTHINILLDFYISCDETKVYEWLFIIEENKHYAQTTYREEYREVCRHNKTSCYCPVHTNHERDSLTTTIDLTPTYGSPRQHKSGL